MPREEKPFEALKAYLPDGSYPKVHRYLQLFKVHLTITRERKTILGDYRHKTRSLNHRISINGNLNKYAFLVTLLHELAHLLAYEKYGNKIRSHGEEWQHTFSRLLTIFSGKGFFPEGIEEALKKTIKKPAASCNGDIELTRELNKFNELKPNQTLIENIQPHSYFKLPDGKIFQMKEKRRKRYLCVEMQSKRFYLFSATYVVEKVTA